jgi:hypothetical protein
MLVNALMEFRLLNKKCGLIWALRLQSRVARLMLVCIARVSISRVASGPEPLVKRTASK